jgi:3-hydroxyisobutyrate dehydrogenase
MAMTVGCIGLGVFGARVATRLGREGFGLLVHDIHVEPVRYFLLKNSADMGESPRMLAALCDVVIAALPDAAATRKAALGRLGMAEGLSGGKTCVLLDLGTTSAAEARALAADLAPHGIQYVEAPARGSPVEAREGRLVIPVGGEAEAVARAMPVLRALGESVTHTGEVGSAHLISALVEQVRAATALALAEALAVGKAAGVAPDALAEWCRKEGLVAPALERLARENPADTGHALDTLTHNLGLMTAISAEQGLDPRLGGLVARMWSEAQAALGPQRDMAELRRWLEPALRAPKADT